MDLDQTILHATWEPYIANWVKERKAENNPVVKDIRQFTLDGSPLIYSIKLRCVCVHMKYFVLTSH